MFLIFALRFYFFSLANHQLFKINYKTTNKKLVLAAGVFAAVCTANINVVDAQSTGYLSDVQQGQTPF